MSKFQQDISKYIQGLTEFSSDIFWIKNADFTKQIYISPAYEKIWKRTCESMYEDPKSWTDYIFPEDLERLHATIEKCRQNITPETRYTEIYRIKRPDGAVIWLKEKGFAIYDNYDNLIGFGGVAQDITNLKKTEKVEAKMQKMSLARDTYEEYLHSTIDSIAGNHWWKDKEGVYRGYNRTLLKSLGYKSPSDIIGKTDYELPWADKADHLVAHDREVMRRGVAIEREEIVISAVGQRRVYLVNKAPLRNPSGKIIGTIGHGFDITEMKEAQEKLEAAKIELEAEKNSIDVRLNSVVERMAGHYWIKDLRGYYLACNDSLAKKYGLEHSSNVVGKTDYELPWSDQAEAYIASDKKVLETEKIITSELQFTDQKGNECHYLVTKMPLRDHEGEIMGVIANATDITDQKRIILDLKTAKQLAEKDYATKLNYFSSLISKVEDSAGMIVETSERLEQNVLDPELKKQVSIIRETADNLCAVFSDAHQSIASNKKSFENYRILLVEDNFLNQKVMKVLLEDLGCTICIVSNGNEAMEKLKTESFNLIFMDVGLPESDGVELAERLRSLEAFKTLPIVMLTAHIDDLEIQRCHDIGIEDVLIKPVTSRDLKSALTKFRAKALRELVDINA